MRWLAAMLLFAVTAADVRAAAGEPFAIGPWRLGMTREEVRSFGEFGPYAAVRVTGGLETPHGRFQDRQTNVSFVFDDEGLAYVQVWKYEGAEADLRVLLGRVLGTARELTGKFRRERDVESTIMFDMRPLAQPAGSRLHSQWGYSSRHDTFYVFLYQDRPEAPPRKIASNLRLENATP